MSTIADLDFEVADGTLLTAYSGVSKHTSFSASAAAVITSGRARCNANTTVQSYIVDANPNDTTYWVDFVVWKESAEAGLNLQIGLSASEFTNYSWQWDGTQWSLFRWNNFSFTDLVTSYTPTWSDGTSKTWRVTRTVDVSTVIIKLWMDGVEVASYTDSDASRISAVGHAGFHWYQSSNGAGVGLHIDEITVADNNVDYNEISVTNAALKWTENTTRVTSTAAVCNNTGTILKTNFTGPLIGIQVDVSALVSNAIAANSYPRIQWRIDAAADADPDVGWSSPRLLTSSDSAVVLESGLSSGTHSLELAFRGLFADYDRWTTPVGAVVIEKVLVDIGEDVSAPTLRPKRILWFGDSNSEGSEVIGAVGSNADAGNSDATLAMPNWAAKIVDAEVSQCGFGSQGWITTGNGNVPTFANAWDLKSSGRSRINTGLLEYQPTHIVICHGQNDGSSIQATIETEVPLIRDAAPDAYIWLVVAPNQNRRADVLAAHATLSATDDRVGLIDNETNYLTGGTYNTNAYHLNALGHETFGTIIGDAMLAGEVPSIDSVTAPTSSTIGLTETALSITWTYSGDIPSVTIKLSTDGGSTYDRTLVTGTTNDGSYDYTPDADDVSATVKIKVESSTDSGVFDVSDTFVIATTEATGGVGTSIVGFGSMLIRPARVGE